MNPKIPSLRDVVAASAALATLLSMSNAAAVDAQGNDPVDTSRQVQLAPGPLQFGSTYTRDSFQRRNFRVVDIGGDAGNGVARRLTYLNYGYASVSKGPDGMLRCDYGDNTTAREAALADYGRRVSARDSLDRIGDPEITTLGGNFNQLRKFKQRHGTKLLISLGGPGSHADLAAAASTEAGRRRLAESCVSLYLDGDLPAAPSGAGGRGAASGVFDGINLEWLSPREDEIQSGLSAGIEWQDYLALVRMFRDTLGANNDSRLLTATMNAAEASPRAAMGQAIAGELNWINIPAYDFTGAWNATTGHASGMTVSKSWARGDGVSHRSLSGLIEHMRDSGIPELKQVYGIALHGQGWTQVSAGRNHGLGMPGKPIPPALGGSTRSYRDLATMKKGYRYYIEPAAKAMFSYDGSTFWSFDTARTIRDKVYLIQKPRKLGGLFASDISGDKDDSLMLRIMAFQHQY